MCKPLFPLLPSLPLSLSPSLPLSLPPFNLNGIYPLHVPLHVPPLIPLSSPLIPPSSPPPNPPYTPNLIIIIPRLIKNMIPMPPHTLSSKQLREAPPLRYIPLIDPPSPFTLARR